MALSAPVTPVLTGCLEAAELMLMLLQPAWQGERYSTPLSPQTGWKMESGHKQSLRQAGGCGCIELDVLPEKQEARNQTKQGQETALYSSPARVPGLADVPACLCLFWASATQGSELSPWEPVVNLPLFWKSWLFPFILTLGAQTHQVLSWKGLASKSHGHCQSQNDQLIETLLKEMVDAPVTSLVIFAFSHLPARFWLKVVAGIFGGIWGSH